MLSTQWLLNVHREKLTVHYFYLLLIMVALCVTENDCYNLHMLLLFPNQLSLPSVNHISHRSNAIEGEKTHFFQSFSGSASQFCDIILQCEEI